MPCTEAERKMRSLSIERQAWGRQDYAMDEANKNLALGLVRSNEGATL